jgi:CoA-transferase family III/Vitamin B12 dependent methionine synthase, activation domain
MDGIEPNCLKGVRVLDLTQFEAGPSCTETLAWLGTEVVKVGDPKAGEPGRTLGSGPTPGAEPYYFMIYNANKKSVTIDLNSERGLSLVKELAGRADVFVENFAPGAIERLGLGWEVMHALHPRLIYGQVKRFGSGSPHEKSLAFDMIAEEARDTEAMLNQGYRGSRYSFGYPACPNLADQKQLLELLHADEIGIALSEEDQLDPEQSTSAIIVHHPQAKYFSV